MSTRWLAIVPARGGSKGIPRKNLAPVAGRPLIALTLDAVRESRSEIPDLEVFVSTDDREIKDAAEAEGFPVPSLRPSELSGDHAASMGYVLFTLDWYRRRGRRFDAVMVLQPTSPLRPAAAIVEAVRRLESQPDAQTLISGYLEPDINPDILYRATEDGFGAPLSPRHGAGGRRQDVAPMVVRNGAIYAARTAFIEAEGRMIDDHPLLLLMPRSLSLNIDHPDDLEALRARLDATRKAS